MAVLSSADRIVVDSDCWSSR